MLVNTTFFPIRTRVYMYIYKLKLSLYIYYNYYFYYKFTLHEAGELARPCDLNIGRLPFSAHAPRCHSSYRARVIFRCLLDVEAMAGLFLEWWRSQTSVRVYIGFLQQKLSRFLAKNAVTGFLNVL